MQVRKLSLLMFFVVLALFAFNHKALAAATDFKISESDSSKVRLIASQYQKADGKTGLMAALHFEIKDGWKIYGPLDKNDGISLGQPPALEFSGSKNVAISKYKIFWPKPIKESETIGKEVYSYLVYKNELILPIDLPLTDAKKASDISLKIDYGICNKICIPVSLKFDLTIPAEEIDHKSLTLIQNHLEDKSLILLPEALKAENKIINQSGEFSDNSRIKTVIGFLFLAFIGGLVLNVMPCVLPVLSIKLLNVVSHSGSDLRKVRFSYLATILGIVFCFLILAGFTIFLKLAGNSLGWGLQFQNPYFLTFLIVILVVFISNLLGSFEINLDGSLASILNENISKQETYHHVFLPNFLSGILAVLLATPCSAPFLGTAISFALSQDATKICAIFLAVSFGLAFPYFVLIAFPSLSYLLPKPGIWMVKVKNLMAGFLAATIIWLIYILIDNIGFIPAMLNALLAVSLLFFLGKILPKSNIKNWFKVLVATLLILAIFILPVRLSKNFVIKEKEFDQIWVKFDQSKIEQLVLSGKTVVIDITADWCITCKANKLLVLENKEILAKLKSANIIAMRGDLTNPDEEIMNFLRSHNRYAIPFNIIYGPNAKQGLLASELLSKSEFLDLIKKASGASGASGE